jgi:hypothetical protein
LLAWHAFSALSVLCAWQANNSKAQAERRCVYCGVRAPAALDHDSAPKARGCRCGSACMLAVSHLTMQRPQGTGYITCGSCGGLGDAQAAAAAAVAAGHKHGKPGHAALPAAAAAASSERCACCSGTGRVMCIGCLCTGKKVAREHDIRLDPFY